MRLIRSAYFVLVCYAIPISSKSNPLHVNKTTGKLGTGEINCNARPYVDYWTKENFPNPQTDIDVDYCGRKCKPSWICDPEKIIEEHEADQLDMEIKSIQKLDICSCVECGDGHDVYSVSVGIVLQIGTRKVSNGTNIQKRAKEFADYLRLEKWHFSNCSNDIVILLSSNDKLIEISVGSSISQILSHDCLKNVHTEASNLVRKGRYSDALKHIISRLKEVLQHGTCLPLPSGHYENAQGLPSEALVAGISVFIVLLLYGGYMIRQDMAKKNRELEDKKAAYNPHLHLKRHSKVPKGRGNVRKTRPRSGGCVNKRKTVNCIHENSEIKDEKETQIRLLDNTDDTIKKSIKGEKEENKTNVDESSQINSDLSTTETSQLNTQKESRQNDIIELHRLTKHSEREQNQQTEMAPKDPVVTIIITNEDGIDSLENNQDDSV